MSRFAIGAYSSLALLAGCTSNGVHFAPTAGVPNVRPTHTVAALQPNCCARAKIAYVSDAFGGPSFTGAVYAFTFPSGTLLGTLAPPPESFLEVQGLCVDTGGNLYVANTEKSTVDEFSHSGKFLAALSDPNQYPVACAYDETTGELAVSNIIDASGGPGSISIFKGGTVRHTYYPPNLSRVYFLGYEGRTQALWLDGENSSGIVQYDKFVNGKFTTVPITGATIGFPGEVQWSALTKSMNVGGATASGTAAIFQISNRGKVVGTTLLGCSPSGFCGGGQFFIKGPRVTVTGGSSAAVGTYAFPAGGKPLTIFQNPGYVEPIGVAVSEKVP
ncbi:MAG: hypothetical protein JOY69_06430 [Candidatus Eremiobacteraeota bacterium]|nr:hypothetical protein [Candidatus Eremiobacteraeota bacterium]